MARRRPSTRRRSSSGRTKAKGSSGRRSGDVSFKSKGQADFTSNKQTVMENGNDSDRKENCDPLGPLDPQGRPMGDIHSPLHRPNHLNSLINGISGRDSACSLYTSASSTPSCETPSLSSYDCSRTGTPSMQTPSIRTPSIRTPSVFSSSFDNSSFDASSLDYESNTSSLCGTPVTLRRGQPLAELSSSQEESSEESRARKRTEKRKRYRRNKRLRMLAAMHMENSEKEKLCKMTTGTKEGEAVAVEMADEVSDNAVKGSVVENGIKKNDGNDQVTVNGFLTHSKETTNGQEIVDEGFSENFDKAQRKNLEETIVATNTFSTSELVKVDSNKDVVLEKHILNKNNEEVNSVLEELSVNSNNSEVIGNKTELSVIGNNIDEVNGYMDEISVNGKHKDQVDGDIDEISVNEKNSEDVNGNMDEMFVNEEQKDNENESVNEGNQGQDDPPAGETAASEESQESTSEASEEETTTEGESPSPSETRSNPTPERCISECVEAGKETLSSDKQEEIDTIVCTKALPDEVTNAIVNDNIPLINRCDKLELVDVIETEGCKENLVVLEMKNNEKVHEETNGSIGQECLQDTVNSNKSEDSVQETVNTNEIDVTEKRQVKFAEDENEEGEQVVDIPIIMETGYEEIFPEERVQLIDVMKAQDGDDEDIVIFEVQNDEDNDENEANEDEENDNDSKEEVENEQDDKIVSTKEMTDTGKPSGLEEDVQIAQNDVKDEIATSIASDSTKLITGDEAKKPAEKVDAALAELDSIPDGVCESGEVEEEEEDEEEWSYYRMEPQTHPQGDDILNSGAPAAVPSKPIEDIEIISEPVDLVQEEKLLAEEPKVSTEVATDRLEVNTELVEEPEKHDIVENLDDTPVVGVRTPDIIESKMDMLPSLDDHPERLINFSAPGIEKTDLNDVNFEQNSPIDSGSPRAPGSPRSVEGFVTSVELNTADESYATNFAVNQAQDGFTGPVMDQTSGPFSVYVSSSPEPASLDPPAQSSIDLLNMSASMTNGQLDNDHSLNPMEDRNASPVEIVHAQSTVEVVAPPSPVEISGPETQFIMPDQEVPDPASVQMPPTDISFVPQPIIEPSAEVPVPVYVDDTPVSEPDTVPDINQAMSVTEEVVTASKTETLLTEAESLIENTEASKPEADVGNKTDAAKNIGENEGKEELLLSDEKDASSPIMSPELETKEVIEERTSPLNSEMVIVPDIIPNKDLETVSPEPVQDKAPEPVEVKSPEPEVKSPEPEVNLPETVEIKSTDAEVTKPVEAKSPEPAGAKPSKATKTPAKSAGDKAASKATPGRATPGKATPAKATPKSAPTSRTPSTKTPTTRTPVTKSTEKKTPASKPASPAVASRTGPPKPASARPASATTKPTVPKTAAPRPTTKPAPTKAPVTAKSTTAPKPAARTAGTTVPRTGTTAKPSTTRPTSATTTARKPLATKPADKTDGKLVNGTARPSSRPGTAKPTTTAPATRRPVASSTKSTTRPAAEKETKNTTNQILSTRPSKTPSTTSRVSATKTSASHSTTRTTSKVSENTSTAKSRTAASTKTASKTTGAATKKTLVTKSKTSQAGTKETSVKAKTEAAVIDKTEPLVNGENKIADEETSVEVLEKCAVEDIMQSSSEKIITETMSSEQMVVTTETTEVLVNGDH